MIAYERKDPHNPKKAARRRHVAEMVGNATGNIGTGSVKKPHKPVSLSGISTGERSRPSPNENQRTRRQRQRDQRILKGGNKNENLDPRNRKPKPKPSGQGPHVSHGPGAGSGQGGGQAGGGRGNAGGGAGGGGAGGGGRGNRPGNTRRHPPKVPSTNELDDAIEGLRSLDELRAEAAAEINRAISDEVAPYDEALRDATGNKAHDLSSINSMFGSILPAAQAGAQAVAASYQQSLGASGDIMNQALDYQADLRQNRLAEGMALQTEVGGQIDIGAFTAPVDIEQQAFNQAAAGDMLNALGSAQAGAQEAQAFATQVLPLVQKEEISDITFRYNQDINDLRKEIARIRSTKGDRVNERLNELLAQEREYALQKIQADRDWKIAKATIKNEQIRLALEKAQLFGVDGKGNLTLDAVTLGNQNAKDQKERKLKLQARAAEIIDKMRAGGTTTTTQEVKVSPTTPGAIPYDPNNPAAGYYILKDVKQQLPPEHDPNNVYDRLILEGIPKTMARNMTIRAFGLGKNWKPHRAPITATGNLPGVVGGSQSVGGPTPGNTTGWTGQGPKPWWVK